MRALAEPIRRRVDQLEADDDEVFALDADGGVRWRGALVACLRPANDVLAPRIEPLASDLLEAEAKLRVVARLTRWLRAHLSDLLRPLFAARETCLSGPARGLLYQVAEALGSIRHRRAATQIAALGREDRQALARNGLRIGRESIYFPSLLKPTPMALRGLLWSVHAGVAPVTGLALGKPSLPRRRGTSEAFYEAVGYRVLGARAVRVDIVEQVAARARRLVKRGNACAGGELARLLGCRTDELAPAAGRARLPAGDERGGHANLRRSPGMRTFAARPALPEPGSGVALAVRRARGAALRAMSEQRLRLDKWLWYARFYKSRTLASGACATGRIRVNGVSITKAHQAVKAGDVLTFPLGRISASSGCSASACGAVRPSEARLLYEDLAPCGRGCEPARRSIGQAN